MRSAGTTSRLRLNTCMRSRACVYVCLYVQGGHCGPASGRVYMCIRTNGTSAHLFSLLSHVACCICFSCNLHYVQYVQLYSCTDPNMSCSICCVCVFVRLPSFRFRCKINSILCQCGNMKRKTGIAPATKTAPTTVSGLELFASP